MGVLDGLLDDIRSQRDYVAERAPVYARMLDLLPELLPMDRLEAVWSGRSFGAWYERPLLILAALRYDALAEGPTHPLHAALVEEPDPGTVSADAIRESLDPEREVWRSLAARHVQTNETSRAVAWLWPAALLARADADAVVHLFDVGTSAGLNLVADALEPIWSRSDAPVLRVSPLPRVGIRRGFDLRPLDASQEAAARWLRACVWPGQGRREKRLLQAVEAWRSAEPRPELVTAAAEDVPELLPTPGPGERALVFQSVMRDYLSAGERARYEAGIRRWLTSSPPGRSLWVELEVREEARRGGPPAAITAHLGEEDLVLATCEPHPGVLDVDDEAVRAFMDSLA